MTRRRRPRSTLGPGSGSMLLGAGSAGRRHRRGSTFAPRGGGPRVSGRLLVALVVLAGAAVAVVLVVRAKERSHDRKAAATRYARAWARRDAAAMWRALTPSARERWPLARFTALVRAADRAVGVTGVRTGRVGGEDGGRVAIPVAVATQDFGTLRGTVRAPVSGGGGDAGVDWEPYLRLPGLRAGETVRRRSGRRPARASILAADGTPLASDPLGASIAGDPGPPATGLERLYAARLAGHPSERLLFGARTIRKVAARRGRALHTTIRPGLQRKAAAALGNRLGGVAVVRPRDGSVLALAGLAVSAPQPPGSTFKIVTLSAALTHHVATPSSTYPVRQYALLSGTKLRNASDESCGGALPTAFAESCNSVFAPLGAKVGAKRLVAMAEAFGFNETPRIPAAKPSTVGPASRLRDSLAVGAAAIGQERDLATPLEMASVGATIGNHGRRARLRIAESDRVVRNRVVSAKVAGQVRAMMLGVVRSGTGTAAALPGVQVAGKTGTAELRPTAGGPPDPRNTDAWFVAFAPAMKPRVAVAVMLVGAGAGGKAAAPIARQVLAAAL